MNTLYSPSDQDDPPQLFEEQLFEQRFDSAKLYDLAINRLRGQVWLGLMLLTLLVLVASRWLRSNAGYTEPTALGTILYLVFYTIAIGGILLRNTQYVSVFQNIYIVMLHIAIPLSFLFFGGTQGNGDITLFVAIMLALLYGFKRWMVFSFLVGIAAFFYVLYRDTIGLPVDPLLDSTSQFFAAKSVLFILLVLFALLLGYRFYSQLIASYSRFSGDQIAIHQELQNRAGRMQKLSKDLRESRLKIVSSREEERRRLRRDLHDGLGPTLAAQAFRVGAARNVLHSQPQKAETFLADLEDGIEKTLGDVRRLIHELRPHALEQFGLLDAIRQHGQELETPFALALDLPELPVAVAPEVEVAVWHIVQTALDNVALHANAQHCTLRLMQNEKVLTLTVEDDGIGLQPNNLEGVGLISMRERVEEMGGVFLITNVEPHGTRLDAQFPILTDIQREQMDNG